MCWPSKRSRASRMSSQGVSLLSSVRGQERYVYNGHRTYNKALASSPVQTSWSRTEVDPFSWTADSADRSADRIVVDRPIPTGLDRRRRDVAVALPPSDVGLGLSMVDRGEPLLVVAGDD